MVRDIWEESDEYGTVRMATVKTVSIINMIFPYTIPSSSRLIQCYFYQYGDTLHTLVDRTKYKGFFLPGFAKVSEDAFLEQLYVYKSMSHHIVKARTIPL